MSTISFMAAF